VLSSVKVKNENVFDRHEFGIDHSQEEVKKRKRISCETRPKKIGPHSKGEGKKDERIYKK
jgi:hypothetical protein